MPDRRRHRGKHPGDDRLFFRDRHDSLRAGVCELSWLLTRGFAIGSALKLVGDRHDLTVRQRLAVRRSACSDESFARRAAARMTIEAVRGGSLAIDGYNLLITVEAAMSGGLVLVGRDGCCRDLAGVHGTYRKVEETVPALELILEYVSKCDIRHVDWYLDRPVSNSGRLKALMADLIEGRRESGRVPADWNIELVNNPDAVLVSCLEPVVSSDSVILDRCGAWWNLAAELITERIPKTWIVDMRTP